MSYNSKYKGSEIEELLDSVGDKQDKLVSGTNIKTINGQSILGSGNIEISGGSSGGSESSNARKEVVYGGEMLDYVITDMRANVVYWVESVDNIIIDSFEESLQGVDSYDIFTVVISLGTVFGAIVSLTLPDDVFWANGVIPEIVEGDYELSISRISDGNLTKYFAVLTPFKSI